MVVLAVAAVVAVLLRSCGGDSPPQGPPPSADASVRGYLDALGRAENLEVSGTLVSGRNFHASGYSDGRIYGTITVGSQPVPFVRVGESDYISGSSFVWDALGAKSKQEGWVRDDAQVIGELDPLTPGSFRTGLTGAPSRRGGTLLYPSGVTVVLADDGGVRGFSREGYAVVVTPDARASVYTTDALNSARDQIAAAGTEGIAVLRLDKAGRLVVDPPRRGR